MKKLNFNTNYHFYFLLVFGMIISSCQKENLVDATDLPSSSSDKFAGNFLCNVEYDEDGLGGLTYSKDEVIRIWVDGDSLRMQNYAFYIESLDQKVFSNSKPSNGSSGTQTITLTYSNNLETISILDMGAAGSSGPDYILSYDGNKTNYEESIFSNAFHDQHAGLYEFFVDVSEYTDFGTGSPLSFDTTYTADLEASFSSQFITIGDITAGIKSFNVPIFHTYYDGSNIEVGGPYFQGVQKITLTSDSLKVYDYSSWDLSPGGSSGTDVYTYNGRKL